MAICSLWPLSLGVFMLKNFSAYMRLNRFCISLFSLRLCNENGLAFARLAGLSPTTAEMTHPKMQRRHSPVYPLHWRIARLESPCKNVNSADRFLTFACHFGGKSAQIANFVQFLPRFEF
jgi:hypothetical protein